MDGIASSGIPSADGIREHLQKLLQSPVFVTSPSLSRFLAYIVEEALAGRSAQLKEYAIGVCVLGRAQDYDPRLDPIVRVQARNLRTRLKTYYEGIGAADPVRIELPKGTYVPAFRWVEMQPPVAELPSPDVVAAEPAAPEPAEITPVPSPAALVPSGHARWRWPAIALCCLVLGAAAGYVVKGTSPSPPPLTTERARNPEVQSLYLLGRHFYEKLTEDGLSRSIGYFERAIAKDAKFAPAHAALAEALNVMVQFGLAPPREVMPRAKQAALRALELNPNLPDAHIALGAIHEAYDWDFPAARREFRKAVELNPKHASARLWYGLFLWDQGQFEEAVPEIERAYQLDPASPFTTATMATIQMRRGNYALAQDLFKTVLAMEPLSPSAHLKLSMLYQKTSKRSESLASLRRARELGSDEPMLVAWLAMSYEHMGMRQTALDVRADLERLAARKYVSPFELAMVYDATGDAERAIAYFEKAFEERSSGFAYFSKRKFKSVQSHPRFASLLRKASHQPS